jgi:hypothetical protein
MSPSGVGTLGYVAAQSGTSKQELRKEARLCGIEPAFSEQTEQEEPG